MTDPFALPIYLEHTTDDGVVYRVRSSKTFGLAEIICKPRGQDGCFTIAGWREHDGCVDFAGLGDRLTDHMDFFPLIAFIRFGQNLAKLRLQMDAP